MHYYFNERRLSWKALVGVKNEGAEQKQYETEEEGKVDGDTANQVTLQIENLRQTLLYIVSVAAIYGDPEEPKEYPQ